MKIQLKITYLIKFLKEYIFANLIMSIIAAYFVVSILIKIVFSFNMLIPCLWKTLFHFDCIGCGLTTAFLKLLSMDIAGAYHANPLIFIVLPVGLFYVVHDFRKFNLSINEE